MHRDQVRSALGAVKGFSDPKVHLEQYLTTPELAASIVEMVSRETEGLDEYSVLDLGCGTGMLSFAASLYGCPLVISCDLDMEALRIMQSNMQSLSFKYSLGSVEQLLVDVRTLPRFIRTKLDVALTNPPFGTKNNKGLDVVFLDVAKQLSMTKVFSLHKTSTSKFLTKKCHGSLLAMMQFEIPHQFKFHQYDRKYIDVGLFEYSAPFEREHEEDRARD